MRLINVNTGKVQKFAEKDTPGYAILSHTWGKDEDELTLQDVQRGTLEKAGKIKLDGCCKQAKEDGLGYVWIDTCCIDKANSVELSEAINSMFRWYREAAICYAYLSDVPSAENHFESESDEDSKFFSSRWFLRGWTLQELLAPAELHFYDQGWNSIGTKRGLAGEVEEITGIPRRFLRGMDLQQASVAQRMSWAANRETSRVEDVAYSLLGIFGVSMSMIYGEGEQAFFRLQEAIVKAINDDSILSWGFQSSDSLLSDAKDLRSAGALAMSPSDFAGCARIVPRRPDPRPFDISAGGRLRIDASLLTDSADEVYHLLNCGPESDPELVVGIPLCKAVSGAQSDEYFRPEGQNLVLRPWAGLTLSTETVYVQLARQSRAPREAATGRYWFDVGGHRQLNLRVVEQYPPKDWKKGSGVISEGAFTRRYLARYRSRDDGCLDFVVVLELKKVEVEKAGPPMRPSCHVMTCSQKSSLKDISNAFTFLSTKVLGRDMASNGRFNLKVSLEVNWLAHGLECLLKLARGPETDRATVDVTSELPQAELKLELFQNFEDEDRARAQMKQLGEEKDKTGVPLDEMQEQLREVEEKLKALNEEKDSLLEGLKQRKRQIAELAKKGNEAEQWQGKLLKRRLELQGLLGLDKKEGPATWLEMTVQAMLRGHPGIDTKNDAFRSLTLCWAAAEGNEPLARLLIENGADVQEKDANGRAPLSLAARAGRLNVVQLLVENGADLEARDQKGHTPLIRAATFGHLAVVRLLVEKKANLEARDIEGYTPIIWAAAYGHQAVVQLLIENGADLEAKSNAGHTPLLAAEARKHSSVVRLLIEKGATRDNRRGKPDAAEGAPLERSATPGRFSRSSTNAS